jgi:HAE1 family hydrophobic/amphiphilic exporter-1
MRLVLAAKGDSGQRCQAAADRLRRYADEDLKKRLEPVEGVAAVKVSGGLEDEVQVDIDQQKLAQLNLDRHRDRAPASRRTSTSPAGAWKKDRSATWCAPSTSSPTSRKCATCWSPRAAAAVVPARRRKRQQAVSRIAGSSPEAAAAAAGALRPRSGRQRGRRPSRYACATWPASSQGYKEREAIIRLGGAKRSNSRSTRKATPTPCPWPTPCMRRWID